MPPFSLTYNKRVLIGSAIVLVLAVYAVWNWQQISRPLSVGAAPAAITGIEEIGRINALQREMKAFKKPLMGIPKMPAAFNPRTVKTARSFSVSANPVKKAASSVPVLPRSSTAGKVSQGYVAPRLSEPSKG